MPLIKNATEVEDLYCRLPDDAPVPADGAVLISADRFLKEADALTHRAAPTGVIWPNHRDVAELAPFLHRLALVALVFPTFKDGRAYSQAHLLRTRYGFKGEIRATGDVLRDQFAFLHRSGFDAFEVKKPEDARAFRKALERYHVVYQPAADGAQGVLWRRVGASSPHNQATRELIP